MTVVSKSLKADVSKVSSLREQIVIMQVVREPFVACFHVSFETSFEILRLILIGCISHHPSCYAKYMRQPFADFYAKLFCLCRISSRFERSYSPNSQTFRCYWSQEGEDFMLEFLSFKAEEFKIHSARKEIFRFNLSFHGASKVIRDCIGFVFLVLLIGLEDLRHLFSQYRAWNCA